MNDFITLSCKSCGGKLQISPEIDDFACMYCGTEFQVKRDGGIIALTPLVDEIKKVSISTDKTATELSIIRLKEEISSIKSEIHDDENKLLEWKKIKKTEVKNNLKVSRYMKYPTFVVALIAALPTMFIIGGIFSGTNVSGPFIVIGLFVGILAAIFFLLTWINPMDIYRKNKILEIKNSVSLRNKEYAQKKERFDVFKDQKEREIENLKKILVGVV